jgi:hypothetical protein
VGSDARELSCSPSLRSDAGSQVARCSAAQLVPQTPACRDLSRTHCLLERRRHGWPLAAHRLHTVQSAGHMTTPIQADTGQDGLHVVEMEKGNGPPCAMSAVRLPLTSLTCWAAGDAGCGSTAGPAAATTRSNLPTASLSRALHECSPDLLASALTDGDRLHAGPQRCVWRGTMQYLSSGRLVSVVASCACSCCGAGLSCISSAECAPGVPPGQQESHDRHSGTPII